MGALYVVGFGPGDAGNMTENARLFLEQADVIVGYSGYIKLLRPLFPDKCFYHTGMTGERGALSGGAAACERGQASRTGLQRGWRGVWHGKPDL